jgi:integrase
MPSRTEAPPLAPELRLLLSKEEAAAALAMSVRHFERHVQTDLPRLQTGRLTLYRLTDLKRWAGSTSSQELTDDQPQAHNSGRRVTRTDWPCVEVRHKVQCRAVAGGRCRCKPGYVARVWDPQRRRPVQSPTFRSAREAVAWQREARTAFKHGKSLPVPRVKVNEAIERFLAAIEAGAALNKRGKPYKQSAVRTIESALKGRIEQELGSLLLDEVRRRHVQTLVDEMVTEKLSGSRVRNVLNALRSLYTYAIARDLAQNSPTAHILLPALDENPRDRIATPREFQELLRALEPADALPFALAGYATARSQEILNLTWAEVDWKAGMIQLAEQEAYAKSDAARRPFPLIPLLRRILQAEWTRQGRPGKWHLVCPGRKPGGRNSGKLSTSALYARADKAWDAHELAHIRLHESRHTASSWMRAAGIDLKTRSVLMGHASTASTDGGRGSITDDRYTHLLPGDLENAGKQLAAYVTAQTKER